MLTWRNSGVDFTGDAVNLNAGPMRSDDVSRSLEDKVAVTLTRAEGTT
jgi:hypothetical protein